MKPHRAVTLPRAAAVILFAFGVACGGTKTGTQTNWLRTCQIDAQCGDGLDCVCGACTLACEENGSSCAEFPGAECIPGSDVGAVALCGGTTPPTAGLCLASCEAGDCPDGTTCVAGVCSPLRETTELLTVDTSVDYQTLVGFGAGVSYIDDEIANYSDSAALYDAMFAESGFEVLRLRNRRDTGSVDLAGSAEIVEAAEERLGRAPTLLLTSSSPPGELKADGQRLCPGNVETCTLARAADGNFDYAGFAEYWRASLEEYAAQGVEPDYISIQNDPNWVPPEQAPLEACRFLPTEGTATVSVNGSDVEVEYAGYAEALAAVQDELAGLPVVPRIAAPEATSVSSTVEFAQELDMGRVDALAHHMYSTDPRAVDRDTLRALADLGQANSRPIFQTEMIAEGLETAMLIHEALGTIGASVYLQNDFVGSAGLTTPNRTALISLHEEEFTLEDTYYAMRHFARYTEPGWVRVAAEPDTGSVLATAWESPDSAAVTVVLVNPELAEAVVEIAFTEQPSNTQVIRTVFPGSERAAELGPLPPNNIVTLPGESIVTVAVRR